MAKKDTYYFPHDYHARHDPELESLRMVIGPIGDGIYWDLVEMLYEQGGYLSLQSIPTIAKSLNTTEELINKVIKTKLFSINELNFYSESLLYRLKKIKAKIRKAKTSAKKRWYAKALPTHSEGNAIKGNEIKGNEIKEDKDLKAEGKKRPAVNNLLKTELDKVFKDGFNIYALINKIKVESKSGATIPDDVLFRVCSRYWQDKSTIKDAWPWFIAVVRREWELYNTESFKKAPMAQSIKSILGAK